MSCIRPMYHVELPWQVFPQGGMLGTPGSARFSKDLSIMFHLGGAPIIKQNRFCLIVQHSSQGLGMAKGEEANELQDYRGNQDGFAEGAVNSSVVNSNLPPTT